MTDNIPWIAWNGGDRPFNNDIPVIVNFRDGRMLLMWAGERPWIHTNDCDDIVAYCQLHYDAPPAPAPAATRPEPGRLELAGMIASGDWANSEIDESTCQNASAENAAAVYLSMADALIAEHERTKPTNPALGIRP